MAFQPLPFGTSFAFSLVMISTIKATNEYSKSKTSITKRSPGELVDKFGRKMTKLRVSTTDGCNFKCFYCMPDKKVMKASDNLLPPGELKRLCSHLVDMGVDHIRLTGGEPTLRKEFPQILSELGKLPLKSFGLTTNGFKLSRLVPELKQAGCTRVNVSIDSLTESGFKKITGRPMLTHILEGVFEAISAGLKVKVNTVLLRNQNDHEIIDFLEFSSRFAIPVRFIEYLHIGPDPRLHSKLYISADEIMKQILPHRSVEPLSVAIDSTSKMYRDNLGAEFGFIASESKPFCSGCSRLRLSAKGKLSACLFADSGISIRNKNKQEIKQAVETLIPTKPINRPFYQPKPMSRIGG